MTQIKAVDLPPRIFNIKGWIHLTQPSDLISAFNSALKNSGFKILKYTDHEFPLNDFTAFWLLAESHLAIHTFTNSGWSYIELSSCNKEKTLKFITLCNQSSFSFKWENEMEELNCTTEVKTN